MKAAEVIAKLPESDVYERDRVLLELYLAGHVVVDWAWLRIGDLEVEVMRDAMRWGERGDSVRLGTTAWTEQVILDHEDALLLTPKLCDAIAARALRDGGLVPPQTQAINARTSGYVKHSAAIDALLPAGYDGVVAGFKDYCLSADVWRKRGFITNYGWHWPAALRAQVHLPLIPSVTDPSLLVVQGPYEAHDVGTDADGDGDADSGHGDYSQMLRGVRRPCRYRGQPADLADVLMGLHGKDAALLASSDAVLPGWRLPTVPHAKGRETSDSAPRVTKLGETGPDALAWQVFLISLGAPYAAMIKGNGGPIAKHGPATEAATKLWLQAQVPRPTHLAAATAPRPVVAPSGGMYDLTSLVLKQARQYREGRVAAVRQVTIHTAEIGETPNGAEALASVASTSERRASWNYAVDCDSVTFSVRAGDTAYAAGPGNDSGVHIELAGRASQDASGWSDDYSRAELALAARLVAALLHEHQLPAVKLDPFDLLPDAMKPGVCGHYAWSAASVEARRRGLKNPPWWSRSKSAWRSTDHVDPGTHFPWPSLMATVRDLRGS